MILNLGYVMERKNVFIFPLFILNRLFLKPCRNTWSFSLKNKQTFGLKRNPQKKTTTFTECGCVIAKTVCGGEDRADWLMVLEKHCAISHHLPCIPCNLSCSRPALLHEGCLSTHGSNKKPVLTGAELLQVESCLVCSLFNSHQRIPQACSLPLC